MLELLRSLLKERRGASAVYFAIVMVPLLLASGMAIDYSRAMRAKTKFDSIADSAALYAVSAPLMFLSDADAASRAKALFNDQAGDFIAVNNLTIDDLTVSATTGTSGKRTVSVSYTAESHNVFATILGRPTLFINGQSATTNAVAPNMDFYFLLDTSMSMAYPTTTAGLSIISNSNSEGCEFACHSSNDVQGTKKNGGKSDLYGVARSYGLTLRIDAEGEAVSQLATDAKNTESKNGATYRMSVSTFNAKTQFDTLLSLTDNLVKAGTATTSLAPPLYYSNGCPQKACASTEPGYDDKGTASNDAFDSINRLIPTPGRGLDGTAPQATLFLVTDGMRDEFRADVAPEVAFDAARCQKLKDEGVRIAVLYTTYLPESLVGDRWSQKYVAPILYKDEPALEACASPGLFTEVSTDGDITAALEALFNTVISTARITQ